MVNKGQGERKLPAESGRNRRFHTRFMGVERRKAWMRGVKPGMT
jgi:hypothetical protein